MVRTLIAIAVAGAFALPMTSQASDSILVAQAGGGDTGASNRQEGVNPPGSDKHTNPAGKGASTAGATSNRGRFEALDKNHDGYVSRDEAKDASELDTRFSELDRNNDGKLSAEEYNALNSSARGATGTGSKSGRAGVPTTKGPGAQESADRPMGAGGTSK